MTSGTSAPSGVAARRAVSRLLEHALLHHYRSVQHLGRVQGMPRQLMHALVAVRRSTDTRLPRLYRSHRVSPKPHSSVELVHELSDYRRVYTRCRRCVERRTVTCQSSTEAVLQLAVGIEAEDCPACSRVPADNEPQLFPWHVRYDDPDSNSDPDPGSCCSEEASFTLMRNRKTVVYCAPLASRLSS